MPQIIFIGFLAIYIFIGSVSFLSTTSFQLFAEYRRRYFIKNLKHKTNINDICNL